uniref:Uncharacterized protein n=1 Tax=viral metagenome TaxID=1070528 RepID=A0A6C0L2Y5_9ZZZZ|tara:strand:- start:1900 stop:2457 length:558 start_codon:yes stop_codon:yes gene_type:complete
MEKKHEKNLPRIDIEEIEIESLDSPKVLKNVSIKKHSIIKSKPTKEVKAPDFPNPKRKSPLYFKKKPLRRTTSQKFKPISSDDESIDENQMEGVLIEEEAHGLMGKVRKTPINQWRRKEGDEPLRYSLTQRDKLVRERNKKSGKMIPFGGKKKKTLRRKQRKQSGQNLVTKRVKTKKNKRYYTKK